MALAALLALTIFASGPAATPPPATVTIAADEDDQGIPKGAPTDDYRFVAWCYGAMDESISVYQSIIPELKAIDQRIGSPVKEEVPYAKDVAEERIALKRFAAAMEAAERASPRPIGPSGVAAIQQGRSMWDLAKQQPPRQLAHAWLLWGSPDRCEATAKTLKARATLLGQAMAIGAPSVDAPSPAPTPAVDAPPPAASDQTTPPKAPDQPPSSIDSVLDSTQPKPDAPPAPAP